MVTVGRVVRDRIAGSFGQITRESRETVIVKHDRSCLAIERSWLSD